VFRDRYIVLVGNNTSLSDVGKYYYLLNCLQGNAAEAIKCNTVCNTDVVFNASAKSSSGFSLNNCLAPAQNYKVISLTYYFEAVSTSTYLSLILRRCRGRSESMMQIVHSSIYFGEIRPVKKSKNTNYVLLLMVSMPPRSWQSDVYTN